MTWLYYWFSVDLVYMFVLTVRLYLDTFNRILYEISCNGCTLYVDRINFL